MRGKKFWAVVLTICLIVSSIGVMSVMASDDKDIELSVTTDKTALKAGDVVTVSVNLDEFKSTVSNDEHKIITTIQFDVPFDSDIFEYVQGSMKNGYIYAVDELTNTFSDANVDGSVVKVAAVYRGQSVISETTETAPFLTFQLKVKETVKETVSSDLKIDGIILKNQYLDNEYTYNVTPASLKVYADPVISLNGSTTNEKVYTKAVTVSATEDSILVFGDKEEKNPCTVSKAGTYEVTAINPAGGKSSITFEIKPVVESITISAPTKTEYIRGEQLVLDGAVVTASLSNGEKAEIPLENVEVSGYDANMIGNQTITVTYEGKTATFTIHVEDKAVQSLTWKQEPKTSIIEGQGLGAAIENATINVLYEGDDTPISVSVTESMCSKLDETEAKLGQAQTITVTYGSKTITFEVTVNAKQLKKISVKDSPKTEYIEGQNLDLTGGTITATYDNEKSEDISMDNQNVEVSGFDSSKIGTQSLTVTYTYRDKTATTTFDVTVREKAPESIAVKAGTLDTTIIEGLNLNLTGAKLEVIYDNGTKGEVDLTAAMIGSFDNKTVGVQPVTITYTESGKTVTTTIQVTVKEKTVTSVTLAGSTSLSVIEGMDLDLTDVTIDVSYDNGTTETLSVTADMISGYNKETTAPGSYELEVTYKEVKTAQKLALTVTEKKVEKVEITKNAVTEIKEGKAFSFDGELTVTYNNKTTEVVKFTDDSVKVDSSAVDTSKIGTYPVKVTYTHQYKDGTDAYVNELTYNFRVLEKELTGIQISKKPEVLSVVEKMTLDLSGCEITASYDNDTTETYPITIDMLSNYDNTKVGTQTVTVTYNGYTAEMEVVVLAKSVTEVTLKEAPRATTVIEGLALDLSGGKIHVVYDNGDEEDLDITQDMINLDTNVVGIQTVHITYRGKEADKTFDIEVLAKEAEAISTNFDEKEVIQGTDLQALVEGMEVYLEYNNQTRDRLSLDDVEITGYDPEKLGEQKVAVAYTLKSEEEDKVFTVNFTVYVLAKSEIKSDVEGGDDLYSVAFKETAEEIMNQVASALQNITEKYNAHVVLDIKLLSKKTGLTVQPDGMIRVTIDIPDGIDKTKALAMYRLEDGKLTELKSEVAGDKISFETDHFSTFVILEKAVAEPTTEPTTTGKPVETTTAAGSNSPVKTGDTANVIIILAVIALAGIGFVVASRKKEQI